jgi:hypothetical protein
MDQQMMDAWALLASGHNSEAGGEAKKKHPGYVS